MPVENKKHPITGCRADTLFGTWLSPYEHIDSWLNSAWTIVETGQLKEVQAKTEAMNEQNAPLPRYHVDEHGIATISLSGPMTKHSTSFGSLFGGTATSEVRSTLQEIRGNTNIRALFVDLDSWGGTAEGTAELAAAFQKTRGLIPVYGHAEDKCTSACLWPAVFSDRLTCGPAASVGSQGTICRLYDTSGAAKGSGVKPIVIKTGEFKDAYGSSDSPITEAKIKELQRYTDAVNEPFKQAVATARKLTSPQLEEVATARIFVGQDAVRVGLVDAVCTRDEAYANLVTLVSSKAERGPAQTFKKVAAPIRRRSMLTAEQLTQVRQLPGAAAVTEENADTFLFQTVQNNQTRITDLTKTNGTLTQEVETLRTKVPTPVEPKVAQGLTGVAVKELDLLAKTGKLLPEQATLLKGSIVSADGKPVAGAVAQSGDIMVSLETVSKVLELNKPNGLVGEQSPSQPAPRNEPGGTQQDAPVSDARKNELLGLVGHSTAARVVPAS